MEENYKLFDDKLKKVKKEKDYGITMMSISESIVYPEMMGMRQEVWLSAEDKIVINYEDNEDTFEISLNFEDRSFHRAFNLLLTYLHEWCGGKEFNDKVHLSVNTKRLPIKLYTEVEKKVKVDLLKSGEIRDGLVYSRITLGVWINIDKAIEIIGAEKSITNIKIKIEKVEDKENSWEYISCLSFSYHLKCYESGYLANEKNKSIDECRKQEEIHYTKNNKK